MIAAKAEEDRAAVTQLRRPPAELVPGVDRSDRFGPLGQAVAGQYLGAFG